MEGLIKVLNETKLAQLIISMIIWLAIGWQVANNQPVPEIMLVAGSATFSFWFGVSVGQKAATPTNGTKG